MGIVTIFGASGTQGSSILEAILADGTYTPRAVSRSTNSAKSKALIARGVEVVAANLFDKESLKKAIRGSEIVFGLTNFFDPEVFPADPQGKGEITQGKNLVDAAKEEDVKFFIWSSLPSAKKISNGHYTKAYHFENKVEIADYLQATGLPHAVVVTGWFLENLWNFGFLKKTDRGYTIPIPNFGPTDKLKAVWATHDVGQSVLALIKNYTDSSKGVLGGLFPVYSFEVTYPEVAATIAKAIGKEVTFTQVDTTGVPELDETVDTIGVLELDETFAFLAEYPMYPEVPVPNPALVRLGVKFGILEEFVAKEVVPRFK